MAVSPDGRNLYLTGEDEGSLTVLQRRGLTGGLRFIERRLETAGSEDQIRGVDLDVSPDSSSLYATFHCDESRQDICLDRILVYREIRSPARCPFGRSFGRVMWNWKTFTFAGLFGEPGRSQCLHGSRRWVWVFSRSPTTGVLQLRERIRPLEDGRPLLALQMTRDGRQVYVASAGGNLASLSPA